MSVSIIYDLAGFGHVNTGVYYIRTERLLLGFIRGCVCVTSFLIYFILLVTRELLDSLGRVRRIFFNVVRGGKAFKNAEPNKSNLTLRIPSK